MCFVWYCTQNELIIDHTPAYPYETVIQLKFTVSIQLTTVNITAINLQVWGLDGMDVLPIQPYCKNKLYLSYTVMMCSPTSAASTSAFRTNISSRICWSLSGTGFDRYYLFTPFCLFTGTPSSILFILPLTFTLYIFLMLNTEYSQSFPLHQLRVCPSLSFFYCYLLILPS